MYLRKECQVYNRSRDCFVSVPDVSVPDVTYYTIGCIYTWAGTTEDIILSQKEKHTSFLGYIKSLLRVVFAI